MDVFNLGDRVRIKDRPDWPVPPGYLYADAEGIVDKWVDFDEVMDEFKDYVFIKLEKVEGEDENYSGNSIFIREEYLEKI